MLANVGIKRVWAGRPGWTRAPDPRPMPGIAGYANASGGFRTGIVAAPMTARLVAQNLVGEACDLPIEPFLVERFGARVASVA
jgi:glycine/D-amino acid oxidase-like deaminating enzyme